MPKVLFVCKQRNDRYGVSCGLVNSCRFLCNMLHELGVDAKVVSVVDNNCIDREVYNYKPTHVFIEALWVVPEKFRVLLPRYPKIKWYVRTHSNTVFISNEGIAMQWLRGYFEVAKEFGNLEIGPNSKKLIQDLEQSLGVKCAYTPNIYLPPEYSDLKPYTDVQISHDPDVINIGCFGAIRPMKNHLIQAMAAMSFGNEAGKKVHFHINATRLEMAGESVYKNLKDLFKDGKHTLVEHPWVDHPTFWSLIDQMDLGLQVSLSETFNIVAADFAWKQIPIVGSPEIDWLAGWYKATPSDINSITARLWLAYLGKNIGLQTLNRWGLQGYNFKATQAWKKLLSI